MKRSSSGQRTADRPHPPHRRGTAMIMAIICLLLVTTISFSLVRFAVAAQQQAERQGWRIQSAWLAESALSQAVERLRNDATFSDEAWTIDDIGNPNTTGQIAVSVTTDAENTQRRTITVTADFPADDVDRVRTSRRLTFTLPETEPALTN